MGLCLIRCFKLVIFPRPPAIHTIPQFTEEGLTDGRDIREFVVFENPPTGDLKSGIRNLMCLSLKGETLDVLRVWEGKLSHQVTPTPNLYVQGRGLFLGKYHDPAGYAV